jgi:hypothetical protein
MMFFTFLNNMMKERDQWLRKNKVAPVHLALRS